MHECTGLQSIYKTRRATHTVIRMHSITCMAALFNNHPYINSSGTSVGTEFTATYVGVMTTAMTLLSHS